SGDCRIYGVAALAQHLDSCLARLFAGGYHHALAAGRYERAILGEIDRLCGVPGERDNGEREERATDENATDVSLRFHRSSCLRSTRVYASVRRSATSYLLI